MGGDGTVNEGISGLANQSYRPHFGFFPLGTVNDLARALGIPLDPATAIAQFDPSRKRWLDVGQVNDQYFMNVAAIGAIPQGINDVAPEEKTRFGKLAYFINGVKELVNNQSYQFEVEVNNVSKIITSSTLIIGLTNSIGGFETLLPNAKVDDGLLHLVYLKDSHFLDTVSAIPQLMKGVTEDTTSLGYETFTEGKFQSSMVIYKSTLMGTRGSSSYSCQSTPFSHFYLLLRKKNQQTRVSAGFLFINYATVSTLRPLRRRAANTRRPFLLPYGYGNRVYVRDGFYLVEKYVSR